MTASVTYGRALRYAKGSARGLLHHHMGHSLCLTALGLHLCMTANVCAAQRCIIVPRIIASISVTT